jgi:hypothetical protein
MKRQAALVPLLAILAGSAWAQTIPWDRIENVKAAAIQLAEWQKNKGLIGALAEINVCYGRELAGADRLTRGLEACLAQDIMNAKVTAQLYRSLSPEAQRISGSPTPEAVLRAMAQRVVGVVARLRMPAEEARQLNRQVEEHGLPSLLKAQFPKAKP